MIDKDICTRFYVITVRSSLKNEFETLCEEKSAILKFEGKLDFEPKNLIENVAELLRQPIEGAGKNLLSEFEEHVGKIETLVGRVSSLSTDEKEVLMVSLRWIEKALSKSSGSYFFKRELSSPNRKDMWLKLVNRADTVLKMNFLDKIKGAIQNRISGAISAIQEWRKNYA